MLRLQYSSTSKAFTGATGEMEVLMPQVLGVEGKSRAVGRCGVGLRFDTTAGCSRE